ncbi:hypothetical protein FGG51_gp010 [Mycobacterium phage Astro]|uniref:Uncharacterized protein n=1 Tax=Mycobacterium phage Astro TaxID=2902840 RepID=I6S368_9CAUD|nr:hypothetical protein FGG51_gp010 [Mycobacterium phage Astro]AFM54982.1 hypothetical protein ASTRO_96 [Mycobacterium phage Astro]
MRHILSFIGNPVGLTRPYRYQVVELESLGKVQLWSDWGGDRWDIGHSKEIPVDLSAESVADIMRDFITGVIDSDEYNALLPW